MDRKSSQEYPVNAGVHQVCILGLAFFLLYINDLPDDVMYNIAKFDLPSVLWQQLELFSELNSDLRDLVDWGRKWLVDFKNLLLRCLGLTLSSKLYWCSYIISVAKLPPRKLEP